MAHQATERNTDNWINEYTKPHHRVAVSMGRYIAGALLAISAFCCATGRAVPAPRDPIQAAVDDASRPSGDVARDINRKPAQTLTFAGIKPGEVVADYIANSGYFTRLLSDVVGPKGHVYAIELNEIIGYPNVAAGYATLKTWARQRSNVTIDTVAASAPLKFSRKLDVFWISQNYHDLHDKFLGPRDLSVFNRQVYGALKPGGLYIVLDHSAAPGAAADVTETLHRIDPATVTREVEAAGFELLETSDLLANPDDARTKGVFDPSIAGHTDQFLLKFRKPLGSNINAPR
jgi:predicted methyltransferase